ncbi:response regulator transcription factor [Mesorhizobium sp.]|uniref:response regulator transcription factor n=1 Tax=Mesorhizobium sp. TaxID=1871066 RepID=UPI00122AC343|nr:response regulator transcription factor [Mesorhizobium sp.]TIO04672.1 MAG: response regulator transcription factor [Mesorhizobium sp.]TIO29400.1 MAG: response regulator transcription factor [Mesorhizobium sp.]TIP09061.1 MAG: response regulator transcription factor [Mesorhizobium sp.]
MRPCILVCSSDASYYLLISYILEIEGFACLPASDCVKTLELLPQCPFTSVLLDCSDSSCMPDAIDRLCQASKERSIPLIAVLPSRNEALYFGLLKAGVDHILVSPHSPSQIVRALRALAGMGKQITSLANIGEAGLSWGKLELFPRQHRVRYDGKGIVLGPIQFRLLATMMVDPRRIFSREELIRAAWAPNIHVEPRTVDVHMGRLREALRKAAGRDLIRTVRSAGYGLDASG